MSHDDARLIDAKIAALGDGRGEMLGRVRAIIARRHDLHW